MGFLATEEQRDFARSLDAMLAAAGTPTVIRAWAAGDPSPGRALWSRLAEAGVLALAVPEPYEGVGPLPVELVTAFVELGRHGVPGPAVETVAASALLAELARQGDDGPAKRLLPGIATGGTIATLAVGAPPAPPRGAALDADSADLVLVVRGDELRIADGYEDVRISADPARRFARPAPGGELLAAGPGVTAAVARAGDWALLATAAQALGVGLTLLDRTVAYAKQRRQFGAAIGSFQAVKHRLADTLIALEFARPLVFGAALTFASTDLASTGLASTGLATTGLASTDLAAAKVTAGEAAYTAARTALQIHGAIGYTEELDLSLWLRKARPLRDAWGTPSWCRARVLDAYGGS
ncbi:acyl-CoA dehydrogenase family protein [Streptomyces sp. NPDC046237]|uniref:acyl-CoA dehydrogenase family protein n=1 Tax=Streptomyces sp. NPDC046237 TaxID=3154914 RepID=UPI0033C70070